MTVAGMAVTGAIVAGLLGWFAKPLVDRVAEKPSSRLLTPRALAGFAAGGGVIAGLLATTAAEAAAFGVLWFGWALLAAIDLAEERLPDRIVGPGYLAFGALLTLAAGLAGLWPRLGRAALAGLVVFVVYFVLAWINPRGLYFGDVKLSGQIGLFLGWFGWTPVWLGVFLGFLLSALVGLGIIVIRHGNRKTEYPFGPLMILGAGLSALLSVHFGL